MAVADYTPAQVAQRLRMSRTHLYKLLDSGQIPSHRVVWRLIHRVRAGLRWTRSSGLLALFTFACAVRPANVNKASKTGLEPAKQR